MAREKMSDRAEARRRYRTEIVPNTLRTSTAPKEGGPATPPARRLGILEAFRLASGPADIPGDLRALPAIALRTPAVWLPSIISIATGLAFFAPDLRSNTIVTFLVQALLAPPAMIPSFLAGFLTRRGSWLVGGIAGIVSAAMAVVIFVGVPGTGSNATTNDYLMIMLIGPVFGASVGAFAGFYRRFLALSSPNRGQPRRRAPKRR